MAMTTKEAHATTNAFYAQMLEAQKRKPESNVEPKVRVPDIPIVIFSIIVPPGSKIFANLLCNRGGETT